MVRLGRRSVAVVTAVTALATTAVIATQVSAMGTGSPATVSENPSATGGLERFAGQKLTWHSCQTGPDDELGKELEAVNAECAEVRVPLDYSKPEGRTITVAISRRKATDTAHRIGTLLVNTGGPSESIASGVTYVMGGEGPFSTVGSPKVAARYDLVSFDPRGHHRSTCSRTTPASTTGSTSTC